MIKVLVIDDSLFMRELISDMLNSDPGIEVIDTAKDGEEAIKKLAVMRPDCITLDLVMRGWDGLTTLKHIMARYPTPVIILSAYSKSDADITIKCLNAGAVGFVLKPSGELSLDIAKVKQELLKEVKAVSKISAAKIELLTRKIPKIPERRLKVLNKIIVIGASTGGPQTLETILRAIPKNLPAPVIIAQHMPTAYFSESLAEHLNKASDLEVKVAEAGEELRSGKVCIAPAGSQTEVETQKRKVVITLTKAKPDILTPSIDAIMRSAAEVYNHNAIGIILTGMGQDGLEGMRAIKLSGGETIAQDESSLIFGMPKAVIDAGLADKVLPAERIVDAMVECVAG
ncbi:MAG: chemotaxis response regulator protein-glutamate methylesterase [Candidatus Omnitrophica bacterium]|nr:chemotaxis response regulator protein-glutamate methylesterase [Candidatus Omnitrophota bacterium]